MSLAPKNVSREELGDSYSDRLYRWVWNRVMGDIGAVPTPGVPRVQLRNVIFVNSPSQQQRFMAAVGVLGVPPSLPAATAGPSESAVVLERLCREHQFLRKYKNRVALMMHVTDDFRERVILSCGFSMELNTEETIVGQGIVFTSDHRHAISQFCNKRFVSVGRVCVVFSWVAIGKPCLVREYTKNRQADCTTHFALTHNGTSITPQGDTPILVSFEPELCCPFAVAEMDLKRNE